MELLDQLGLGHAHLALSSFVACAHPAESCGLNGLPLTPNSITILGRANFLKTLRHANLCAFLDCKRGKNERIITVSEHYEQTLDDLVQLEEDHLLSITKQILLALAYLDHRGIQHTNLESNNILVTPCTKVVKLCNFGLGHMTDYGRCVAFPVNGNPRLTAPEVYLQGPHVIKIDNAEEESTNPSDPQDSIAHIVTQPTPAVYSSKSSVWRLGLILAAKVLEISTLWPNLKVPQVIRKVLSLTHSGQAVLERIARDHNKQHHISKISPALRSLITKCLEPLEARPTPMQLLQSEIFFDGDDTFRQLWIEDHKAGKFPCLKLRCTNLDVDTIDPKAEHPIDVLTIQELYYLWQLAGGDVIAELNKNGLMAQMPPVVSLPKVVLNEGFVQGQVKEKCELYDPCTVIQLSTQQLRSCLDPLGIDDMHVLHMNGDHDEDVNTAESSEEQEQTSKLPLVIKERDVRYQFRRIVLYRKLLQSYPFKRQDICIEAKLDSLPFYRAYIWAALLGIEHDTVARYEAIDKEAWTPTDRQIELDIPRCHQYNNLLASPEGHRKFKRVLKAWVMTNPQYVYWQGLDSLCAPFLYLNFDDEALAFACLSAFIPKYLSGMFLKDNAFVIQEYLAKFAHIQAFHDPILFNHLDGIGFIPDLYAIPWVLTMFSHVFPLHSIFHLWDKLLLGNSCFPLCVALSILYRLRERLLASEFNDCILLFSDLPAINIELCVKDSISIFCSTPKSLSYRRYGTGEGHDQHEDPKYADLTLSSITLSEQKSEKVPRISGQDLLELLGLRLSAQSSIDPSTASKKSAARVIVIDVRPFADFRVGALPESINCPYSSAMCESDKMELPKELVDRLTNRRHEIVCVAGSMHGDKQGESQSFATKLLQMQHPRVCVLHKGIEIYRPFNVLCVPNV